MTALELTLVYLLAAVLGVVACRSLRLPPMLGYLVVGVLIGPNALALAQSSEGVRYLGEFGVVFLMFVIGLEFNLAKLRAMRRHVFGLGLLQVLFTMLAATGATLMLSLVAPGIWGLGWQTALALSGALAMSSTAIVVKLMVERLEMESEHGKRVMGVLLLQDLAVVPLLVPTACANGRAGLVSGPRKLNTVGTRSSRRTGAAWPIAGWKSGANRNPIPASPMQRSTPAASRSIFTSSASSTSAEPQWLEAARFPCLATGTPAPAVTIAATVEMLNVPLRSPPVPTMSTTGTDGSTGFANASMVRARPSTSSTVSPLVRRAIRKPPICPGVASPAITVRITSAASSLLRASRADRRRSIFGQTSGSGSMVRER